MKNLDINFYHFLPTHLSTILLRKHGLISKSTSKRYYQVAIPFTRLFCPTPVSVDYIKSEQNKLSDTQNSVLFAFLSNLSILKNYSKEFLILFENLFKPRQLPSATSKHCFEQPAASFLVCSLIFIEYKIKIFFPRLFLFEKRHV